MVALRIGIAGAGLMGYWHAVYAGRARGRLVALMDRDTARARRLADRLGIRPGLFTEIDSMLESSQLDVLHVCTPLESHYPLAIRAIGAGVHLLVEKPLAASVAETEALLEASRARGTLLCPVHQFGFQRGVREAMRVLESLGELLHVRFTTASAGGQGHAAIELDRIVADIIPHPLSVLQRFCHGICLDEIRWQGVHARSGELHVIGSVDVVSLDCYISMNARPTRCEMELFCSQGRIGLNFFHGYALVERGPATRRQKLTQPFKHALGELRIAGGNLARRALVREPAYPGLAALIEDFYQAVDGAAPPPLQPADVLGVARACETLTRGFLPAVVASAPVAGTASGAGLSGSGA